MSSPSSPAGPRLRKQERPLLVNPDDAKMGLDAAAIAKQREMNQRILGSLNMSKSANAKLETATRTLASMRFLIMVGPPRPPPYAHHPPLDPPPSTAPPPSCLILSFSLRSLVQLSWPSHLLSAPPSLTPQVWTIIIIVTFALVFRTMWVRRACLPPHAMPSTSHPASRPPALSLPLPPGRPQGAAAQLPWCLSRSLPHLFSGGVYSRRSSEKQ